MNPLILLSIVTIIILSSAFKNKQPTCNRFILNTYAYLLFMILFLYTTHLYIIKHLLNTPLLNYFFLLFIVNIVILLRLMYIPAFHPVEKHLYLITWLVSFALISYPMTLKANRMDPSALTEIMVICLSLTLAATGLVVFFPKLVTPAWGLPLFLGLTGLIVAQIFSLFLNTKSLYITYFAIALFTMFISYDTQLAISASKTCVEGKADYIKYSMGLFLDVVNLFVNLENR
jgi:hypothetical protein